MSGMWDECKCRSYGIDPSRDILLPLQQIVRSAAEQQQRLSGWQRFKVLLKGTGAKLWSGEWKQVWLEPGSHLLRYSASGELKQPRSDRSAITFWYFWLLLCHFLTDAGENIARVRFVLLADFKLRQIWLDRMRFPWSLNKNISLVSQSFKSFLCLIRFIRVCLSHSVLNSSVKLITDDGPTMIHHPDNCWLWMCCLFMSAVYHWIYGSHVLGGFPKKRWPLTHSSRVELDTNSPVLKEISSKSGAYLR